MHSIYCCGRNWGQGVRLDVLRRVAANQQRLQSATEV